MRGWGAARGGTVSIKWGKQKYDDVLLDTTQPPLVFKMQLFSLTGVLPERQTVMTKAGTLKVRSGWSGWSGWSRWSGWSGWSEAREGGVEGWKGREEGVERRELG